MFKIKLIIFAILLVVSISNSGAYGELSEEAGNIPIATKWSIDATGDTGRASIQYIYLVHSLPDTKGTGFLINTGHIITNEHVIRGRNENSIIAYSSFGEKITFKKVISDASRDIAILFPSKQIKGGLNVEKKLNYKVGESVITWGHPLGYNGPPPLLSVGYLSGFKSYNTDVPGNILKHLVINGAFNPGNSGGPLFRANDNNVIGIVVSKHAPMPEYLISAVNALKSNQFGMQYEKTDNTGAKVNVSEAQIVADVLEYFRSMTQVMIGEAIDAAELIDFLNEQGIIVR